MLAANSMEGKAEPFLKRIETLMAEADSAKAVYMNEAKARREDLKEVYTEAKDKGIPIKALKGVVKKRALEKKADAIPDGFDEDDAAAYETLCAALGDLGKAAARAAGHDVPDEDRDLRGTDQRAADAQRSDEAALTKVGTGVH